MSHGPTPVEALELADWRRRIAFDPKWACPLAPPENRLDLRIEAGERID